jgi:hypothetical protein
VKVTFQLSQLFVPHIALLHRRSSLLSVKNFMDAVTAFFQFGFQLRTGIAFKTYTNVNTSDWLGPYNLVLAPVPNKGEQLDNDGVLVNEVISLMMKEHNNNNNKNSHSIESHTPVQTFISRYVTTPSSDQLKLPVGSTIVQPEVFDRMLGLTAINQSIHSQRHLHHGDDPYADYLGTCTKGDIPSGILPSIQLGMKKTTATTSMQDRSTSSNTNFTTAAIAAGADTSSPIATDTKLSVSQLLVDFYILSLPDPKSKLYSLWPSLQKHLGSEFPLRGPYCYGNDPRRAYAIQLSYDSRYDQYHNQTWQAIKGCLPDLPCWNDGLAPSPIPYDNGSSGCHIVDPLGTAALLCYLMGLLLVISLIFNCQLSNQLKRMQQLQDQHLVVAPATLSTPSGRPVPTQQVFDAFHDLEEPLLPGNDGPFRSSLSGGDGGGGGGGAEEFKEEATD